MYKGYIITKNKTPLAGETFKNKTSDELRTFEEVKNLPDYAGIIDDPYLVVDVDDAEQYEILLKIVQELQINTHVMRTTRGGHFYFKITDRTPTNKTGCFTAVGLRVDMKLGTRNSYVCLKHDNVSRETIYSTDTIDEIPIWLTPINYTFPFLNMEAGDGRNQSMFNYILTLQSSGFTKAEVRETLQVINNYVLVDPLSDNELDTITRDEAFKDDIFFGGSNGTTFLFDKFASFLKSEYNIIKINGQLHTYQDGIYKPGEKEIEAQMIRHIPSLKQTQRTEVLRYIDLLTMENTEPSDARFVAFKNGIYNIQTEEFVDFSDDYIITNVIPHNYNPSSYSEVADKTLWKMACDDFEIRQLMEEMIGYTFYRRNEMGKAFILTGNKSNGKSTFLKMLQGLLSYDNTASLDLNELGERFKTAELFGKLANIGDDIGSEFIADASVFKKLATGEPVNVERKGQDPFDFVNYSKLLFSANDIPRIKDNTGAVLRRLIIVPFNARFSPDDPDYDPYIAYKLEEPVVYEYLINIGLHGLKRVLENKGFTETEQVKQELREYELENNPFKLYLTTIDFEKDILDIPVKDVYTNYSGFCYANNLKPLGQRKFSRMINDEFNTQSVVSRVDGKTVRVYGKE